MKTFATKKELFKYLVENKEDIINLKKSAIKTADIVSLPAFSVEERTAMKGKYLFENDKEAGVLKRTIVANTYLWMDSHSDVHVNEIFNRSITGGKGTKAPHLHDHIFTLDSRVGKPLKFYEQAISWRELGVGKTGMTQALFMDSEIKRSYNERVYEDYLNNEIDQHSVAMRYIKMALAVDDEENYPNEYKVWKELIHLLGNRKAAEEQGYFFAIYEAALIEVSAVLLGSNELTPTMGKTEPMLITQSHEPAPATRDKSLLEAINKLSKSINI